ncbi:MAG: glucose/arabinose dehydrogenase [Planctomycetota bacterium]|jgi:glucose/arabinose dehydrogenase
MVTHDQDIQLTPVFQGRKFARPVFLTHAPGEKETLYVVEQKGLVLRMENTASDARRIFLDIRERVSRAGNEEGLLGLAFHPDYASNGRLFLHYSKADPREGLISEFRLAPDRQSVDPKSERVLLRQEQPFSNHNGGSIEFGPDGMLYVSFGDGGSAGDPGNRSQDLTTLLGKMLRIDVDSRTNSLAYGIPKDNPFAGTNKVRGEIWALGLRNTYRFSFDPVTEKLWGGDVGQWRREEINIIRKGGNYGWKKYEGNEQFSSTALSTGAAISPVTTYRRSEGFSVTGGYVYRGEKIPRLKGIYIFADYVSGRIWGLWPMGRGQYQKRHLMDTHLRISSFGVDQDGELYVCNHDGAVYRLEPNFDSNAQDNEFPFRLAEADFFKRHDEWQPYQVVSPLWSDGLKKNRYILRPPNNPPLTASEDRFAFADGTYFIKEFYYEQHGAKRLIESRVIVKRRGRFHAVSYLWDERGETAERCDEVSRVKWPSAKGMLSWQVPSPNQCHQCHIEKDNFILGFKPIQLVNNGELARLQELKCVDPQIPLDLAHLLTDPSDEGLPLEGRARSYLDTNCANCHRPDGIGNSPIDLRRSSELAKTNMIDETAHHGIFGVEDAKIVSPGAPDKSVLLNRMESRGIGHMPPLGTSIVDDMGTQLIRSWILGLKH